MTTEDFLQSKIGLAEMNSKILTNFSQMKKRGGEFMEEGIFINPDGMLRFLTKFRKMRHLKGCNMSFHKNAVRAINGFDEEYIKPAVGEDADLLWRFQGLGYQLKSVRNLAVQYHLYHQESWTDQEENLTRMNRNQAASRFICRKGLKKLNSN